MNVTALNTLLSSAQESIQAVDTAQNVLILAVNARQRAFNPLPKLGTRVFNALAGTDASPEFIADVKMIRDRFRAKVSESQKETKLPEGSSNTTPTPADTSRGSISHLDMESKIRNLGNLIQLLASEPSYKPNEADLTVETLSTVIAGLREKHKAVMNARIALSNAKLARKNVVYDANGIYGIGKQVKRYILSVFGSTSDQYRQIKGIKLRKK